MSQIGKLYGYYLEKIGQKNGLRIIVFTILIGVVWGFVLPWASSRSFKGKSFSEVVGNEFKDKNYDLQGKVSTDKVALRKELEDDEYGKKRIKEKPDSEYLIKGERTGKRTIDSASIGPLSYPYNSDNSFFFSRTEEYSKGIAFGKMLFDISGGNLTGVIVLYGFIFEVLNKLFFSSRQESEDTNVLVMTPSVKRSDLLGGKILAFLTFYFLINVAIFLIPFSVYYFGLAQQPSYYGFALLTLITIIVGPLLYFGLIFVPYLFFGSLTGQKGIFSTLIAFSPLIGGAIKMFSLANGTYKLERFFFNPIGFTIISLFCGFFFLNLYYLRYQKEDLN